MNLFPRIPKSFHTEHKNFQCKRAHLYVTTISPFAHKCTHISSTCSLTQGATQNTNPQNTHKYTLWTHISTYEANSFSNNCSHHKEPKYTTIRARTPKITGPTGGQSCKNFVFLALWAILDNKCWLC